MDIHAVIEFELPYRLTIALDNRAKELNTTVAKLVLKAIEKEIYTSDTSSRAAE